MTRTTRAGSMAATPVVALLLSLTSACGAVDKGDVQPDAVEKKAHTLTQQTLDAIHPSTGAAPTSVYSDRWSKCTTETPGQHRFEYDYILKLTVAPNQVKPAITAAHAYFAKEGYKSDYTPYPDRHAGATIPKSTWTVALGLSTSKVLLLEVDSDCVFTRHDPKTKA
ncbi:hypothetical protein [Streptomyces sp. NPDC087270]|uniref:hypothetical protein n=1 Tax=Streptomyces sp. NPDC087270 TaxID=3365774 RepID=UPI0037FEC2FB